MGERVKYVALNLKNRAGVRLLMACLLAKLHRPEVDVRKPYTEIGTADAFSGGEPMMSDILLLLSINTIYPVTLPLLSSPLLYETVM